jgi:hypothetical protein
MSSNNEIKFAVVQGGCAVFGTGTTRQEAIADAVEWIEGASSADDIENMLVGRHDAADGDFFILSAGDDEFDGYMENQGAFDKRGGGWFQK